MAHVVQRRKVGLGGLLTASWRVYRGNLAALITIVAVIGVPYALLNVLNSQLDFAADAQDAQGIRNRIRAALAVSYILILQPLQRGALVQAVADHYRSRLVSARRAYQGVGKRCWPLLGSHLLVQLFSSTLLLAGVGVLLGAAFGAFIAFLATSKGTEVNFVLFGVIALVGLALCVAGLVVWLFVTFRLLFTTQIAQLEANGAWGSVRQAWHLSRGAYGQTLGDLVLLGLLGWLIVVLPRLLVAWLEEVVFRFPQPIVVSWPLDNLVHPSVWNWAASSVVETLALPYLMIVWTMMYDARRVRNGGAALEPAADTAEPLEPPR